MITMDKINIIFHVWRRGRSKTFMSKPIKIKTFDFLKILTFGTVATTLEKIFGKN